MAKIKIALVLVLLLICRVHPGLGAPQISDIYLSQVGQVEKPLGSNWGHPVQDYLRVVHLQQPEPWCAAFVAWCLDSAHVANTINGSSGSAQNNHHLVYFHGQLIIAMQAGDVFTIYFPSLGRIGHTGFTHRDLTDNVIETVEGNSNAGGSREGYGVFRRKRPLHTLWSVSRWP